MSQFHCCQLVLLTNIKFVYVSVCVSIFSRHSIETLWKNLRETNPELLVDFEDFVSEIAEEVQGAQRALE